MLLISDVSKFGSFVSVYTSFLQLRYQAALLCVCVRAFFIDSFFSFVLHLFIGYVFSTHAHTVCEIDFQFNAFSLSLIKQFYLRCVSTSGEAFAIISNVSALFERRMNKNKKKKRKLTFVVLCMQLDESPLEYL